MKTNVWYARGYSARVKTTTMSGISKAYFKNDKARFDAFYIGSTQATIDFGESEDPDHVWILSLEKANWDCAHVNPAGSHPLLYGCPCGEKGRHVVMALGALIWAALPDVSGEVEDES